ncbi:TSUP family transporter [Aureimonas pseudogalii]|uniref:Probable membrane transporter protein n=1 Tax=Aureimonas pseudogalii TaxID=1744844 RepID=A0A7W6MM13_9HYPH|nr:TSUP family transporter [Aureimonas pseudogalii]MBB4000330.1 putative membrane protein YfcA [Aureimonas pseudogalii]
MLSAAGDIDLSLYVLVAVVSFFASFIGGVTGYGTGLLLPPILLPIVGPQYVVPIVSLSALLTNGSRVAAFRADLDAGKAALVTAVALPTCLVGAYGYTRLSGAGVSVLLGTVLVLLVPLRRWLKRRHGHLGRNGLAAVGAGYGLLTGGTSGAGVVLLSLLLAAGLQGSAVIATDAGISLLLGIAKVLVFQSAGALPLSAWLMAGLIGFAALPGPFLAKRMTRTLTHRTHAVILDGVVVFGGGLLLLQGLRSLH